MERYRVHILGLSLNVHHFQYEIGADFFRKYDTGLVPEGTFHVDVALDKRETFLEAQFSISGSAKLVCDRSLDSFDYPINLSSTIIFKYGSEDKELSDDVMMIHHGTETLELGQFIYEFIALAVPMKKLHPRFRDEDEEDDEAGKIVYSSDEPEEKKDDETDPRWDILKKLNKN